MPPRLPPPHRVDVAIALGGLLGGLLLTGLGLRGGVYLGELSPIALPYWSTITALVAMAGAELLRRVAPRTALSLGTAALAVDLCGGSLIATVLMYTDLVYAAVLYGPTSLARRLPSGCVLATVVATVAPLALLRTPESLFIGLVTALLTLAPAGTGAIVRNHQEAAEAARLEAERTALLAELDRREAVVAERGRMARELHDRVAGHLSAIAIHSTAALSLGDAAATDQALGVIRENSVRGLAEMRRLIELLRDADRETEPTAAPTLDALDALVERARSDAASVSGLKFTLCDDRPPGGAALPAPVELAAYRIVQESLTNALKHAAPGEVTVRLAQDADGSLDAGALEVSVTSPFDTRPAPRAPGSGMGLIGMRERVCLLGGTLEAGPHTGPSGTVWRVRAALPLDGKGARTR
ncbi:sensor histidine kinase [Streptomyces sp. ME19-01-6]|uniref:sensor histidine kinase n=1 Tax=Streptomyces sp. ME19-01-6 TaxID=3028686 RepID=UPI0029BEF13B|nr:histidine kinase [Streptomyces sp. ME19-01-6]MDX3225450.1 histidine kinase [Streptomyces sp. ME19-01-6]